MQPELFGFFQAAAVSAAQEFGIARSACVNGADRVDDIFGLELEAGRGYGCAGGAPTDAVAGSLHIVPARLLEDGTANSAAASKLRVGCVHDGIGVGVDHAAAQDADFCHVDYLAFFAEAFFLGLAFFLAGAL